MTTATTLERHAAPGQYLGYSLQPVRLCYHLLACCKTSLVSLEYKEDVAVHLAGGAFVFEQMKSALRGNPLSDWSSDFWKTISCWMSAAAAGEIDISRSQFRYYVTPVKTGVFAEMLSNADTPEAVAAATAAIAHALRKKGGKPPQCIEDLQVFLDTPDAQRAAFIARFKVISCDEDPVTPVRDRLRYSVQPELLDDLCKAVIGLAKEEADRLIRQRQPAIISAAEFQTKTHAFIRTMNLANLLISFAPRPPESAVADVVATRPIFIRQLELVEADSDVRLRAVSDFLRSSADKSIWAERGLIFPSNLEEWDDNLIRRHGAIAREIAITSPAATQQERGHLTYDRCTAIQLPLEGRSVPGHFIPGSFNSLANDKRLGWHPDYPALLDGAN